MHGNILLGNRPNFFVEHMTKSQNQPYRFKSGKNTFPWANLLSNVKKKNLNDKFWKNGITEGRYWPKILKQGVFFVQIF